MFKVILGLLWALAGALLCGGSYLVLANRRTKPATTEPEPTEQDNTTVTIPTPAPAIPTETEQSAIEHPHHTDAVLLHHKKKLSRKERKRLKAGDV